MYVLMVANTRHTKQLYDYGVYLHSWKASAVAQALVEKHCWRRLPALKIDFK
jgi:hypothetical protein